MTSWENAPTPKSKEKLRLKMVGLEDEIAQVEGRVANSAHDLADAVAEVARLVVQWDTAAAALETERGARAKRQAIERVVDRIELTFEPTGVKRPSYELRTVRFVPVTRAVRPNSEATEFIQECLATRWT